MEKLLVNKILTDHSGKKRLFFPIEQSALSIDELRTEIRRFHFMLATYGVKQGDIITVRTGNTCAMVVTILGCLAFGVYVMPVNPALKPSEVITLINHAKPKLMLNDLELALEEPDVQQAGLEDYIKYPVAEHNNYEYSEGGIIIYTSGTTGAPKGVRLPQELLIHNMYSIQEVLHKDTSHVAACFLPLFHLFGIASDLLMTLLFGGQVVVLPQFELAAIPAIAKNISQYGVNTFSAVPLMYDMFRKLDAPIPKDQLKLCISGGGPLREEVRIGFNEKYGTNIIPAYGVTECGCYALCNNIANVVPESVGLPVGMEVLVMDLEGNPLKQGETGEIVLSGSSVINEGYFRDNRDCYFHYKGKKWFRTGDLGWRDKEGSFYIAGRIKNMIIKGGAKIYLEDVDQFIQKIDGIDDAASIKANDFSAHEIEEFVSYVVLSETTSHVWNEKLLKSSIREALGSQKVPYKIVFVKHISRTATGKVIVDKLAVETDRG